MPMPLLLTKLQFNKLTLMTLKTFQWADGIQEFVEEHHLNPDKEGWNFRHIFGSFDEKDRHYNTPRVWYGHHLFNPEIEEDPESGELPFIMRTNHKFTPDDIEQYLGSHYNETPYDPIQQGIQRKPICTVTVQSV